MKQATQNSLLEHVADSPISAVDLFCGAGGLTYGLMQAGIRVEAGIDIDEQVKHAYLTNNPGARLLCWDVEGKYCPSIAKLFRQGSIRLLAGCAPCQPFSKLTNRSGTHEDWNLLDNFGRFVRGLLPELVTMENVPELEERGSEVYLRFVGTLEDCGYRVARKLSIANTTAYRSPADAWSFSRPGSARSASPKGAIAFHRSGGPSGRSSADSVRSPLARRIRTIPSTPHRCSRRRTSNGFALHLTMAGHGSTGPST